MNIAPTPAFQEAFANVTGLPCTAFNLVTVMRGSQSVIDAIRAEHAALVEEAAADAREERESQKTRMIYHGIADKGDDR